MRAGAKTKVRRGEREVGRWPEALPTIAQKPAIVPDYSLTYIEQGEFHMPAQPARSA
jgi:hypothetical protein